ncbi:LAME_0F18580g1_1 [Lachancea meyersii CBS 8951]|uniref:LAME_0F18580g1_1 n=1 Tax=Lachancea meyersii CBS 8951 TaxID=1266667 RepID=A0A1G4K0T9_9SACH|nr:LAME_0F18580g1_1 [Lachancea meyersii CBS 8951]
MSTYTCNSCGLQFSSAKDQRDHMKTDWHSYNLKRRVAELPAISEATFNAKVKSFSEQKEEPEKKRQLTKKDVRRKEKEALLAKKKVLLEQARESIISNTQKSHDAESSKVEAAQEVQLETESEQPEKVEKLEETQETQETQEDDLTPDQLAEKLMQEKIDNKVDIPLNHCLFCTKGSPFSDLDEALEHMFKCHGFYIPEQKYLVDKEGLMKYLSEKIGLGNMCLCCNYQGRSLEAVRAHMLAKAHCRIPYESEDERLEISEFYDFSSTYANHPEDAGNEEDWEDVGSGEEGAENEDENEEDVPQEYIYNDGIELHLPTGVKVGHRSLQRYYKQNLKPETVLTEGQGTLIAAETRHFATIADPKQVATQKRVWQTQIKDLKTHDKRAAKFVNNQPHYRDQLLQ